MTKAVVISGRVAIVGIPPTSGRALLASTTAAERLRPTSEGLPATQDRPSCDHEAMRRSMTLASAVIAFYMRPTSGTQASRVFTRGCCDSAAASLGHAATLFPFYVDVADVVPISYAYSSVALLVKLRSFDNHSFPESHGFGNTNFKMPEGE